MSSRDVVIVLSGGLDSTTLAYQLRAEGARLTGLSVDYGQRHGHRELAAARVLAAGLDMPHHIVELHGVEELLRGSALTDTDIAVPDGYYTDESMRITVVPNRNALLIALATSLAVSSGADAVAFGAHAGDHPIYPDCRPAFIMAFEAAMRIGNAGSLTENFQVLAPFAELSKVDVVGIGANLGVPFALTWSCYRGGEVHCGQCGTCVERREAFRDAGVSDPTEYASVDAGSWSCT